MTENLFCAIMIARYRTVKKGQTPEQRFYCCAEYRMSTDGYKPYIITIDNFIVRMKALGIEKIIGSL
jgi:hypothetical protein